MNGKLALSIAVLAVACLLSLAAAEPSVPVTLSFQYTHQVSGDVSPIVLLPVTDTRVNASVDDAMNVTVVTASDPTSTTNLADSDSNDLSVAVRVKVDPKSGATLNDTDSDEEERGNATVRVTREREHADSSDSSDSSANSTSVTTETTLKPGESSTTIVEFPKETNRSAFNDSRVRNATHEHNAAASLSAVLIQLAATVSVGLTLVVMMSAD